MVEYPCSIMISGRVVDGAQPLAVSRAITAVLVDVADHVLPPFQQEWPATEDEYPSDEKR